MRKLAKKIVKKTSGFVITTEPIEKRTLSDPQDEELLQVLYHRVRENDATAEKELLVLAKKYPNVPVIGNYLIVLYKNLNFEKSKIDQLIEEQYELFPDYLFAQVNYVSLCHGKGETDAFLRVFEGKKSLKQLYPNRNIFHITEFTSFASVFCKHLANEGEYDTIEKYIDVIKAIDPDNPCIDYLRNLVLRGNILDAGKPLMDMIKKLQSKKKRTKRR